MALAGCIYFGPKAVIYGLLPTTSQIAASIFVPRGESKTAEPERGPSLTFLALWGSEKIWDIILKERSPNLSEVSPSDSCMPVHKRCPTLTMQVVRQVCWCLLWALCVCQSVVPQLCKKLALDWICLRLFSSSVYVGKHIVCGFLGYGIFYMALTPQTTILHR